MAVELESLAWKKLRSFALFPAKKRAKHEAAYALFGAAARAHLAAGTFDAAGACLRQQARIALNKLQRPIESAAHYLESTRAFMLALDLTASFECIQLAVAARTNPTAKHKGDSLAELAVAGITVTEEPSHQFAMPPPALPLPTSSSPWLTPETRPMAASVDSITHMQRLPMPMLSPGARSPALTGQAGTISLDGRGLFLSPETMQAPISSNGASSGRSMSMVLPAAFTSPSAGLFGTPAVSPSSTATAPVTLQPPPIPLYRRHSLSGCANSSNVTVEGAVVHEVLHLDLLLARLAVQLATDLWNDLDFRDAILALEIASSLFATLLIAERHRGSFRRKSLLTPLLTSIDDPPMKRSESASSPSTPVNSSVPANDAQLSIEARLAGLLGPSAYSSNMSSQTLGARPITTKPLPSIVVANGTSDSPTLVLHTADPHLTVGEGEGFYASSLSDPGTSILEESLVCRFQLANYYITYALELEETEPNTEHQELRRAKALFEQVASQKPDVALVHLTIQPLLTSQLQQSLAPPHVTTTDVEDVSTLIAQYTADDDKQHTCLFLAGLCDALIGVRLYQASQRPRLTASGGKGGKTKLPLTPPPVPELYLALRTVWCPSILLRYRAMSASFGVTCEIRLLRSCSGLLQMAANLSTRLSNAFGGSAPHAAKQLFQAAWGAEIMREFSEVARVYNQQRSLTSIAAKLLLAIKKEMKATIAH